MTTRSRRERNQLNVAITEDTRTLLVAIKDAEGIPYAKQVELAMKKWALEVKGLQLPLVVPEPEPVETPSALRLQDAGADR